MKNIIYTNYCTDSISSLGEGNANLHSLQIRPTLNQYVIVFSVLTASEKV
jgi:hypothetical protein